MKFKLPFHLIHQKIIAQVRTETEKISDDKIFEKFFETTFDIFYEQIRNQIRNQIIFG